MGKKNLLNESTITRFMKLAAINENAAHAFVDSIQEAEEDELGPPEDELTPDDELAGDELAGDELAGDELADDELADDEELGAVGGTEGAVKDMVDAVVGAISDVAEDHGVQVDLAVQGDELEPPEDELAAPEDELAAPEDELAAPEDELGPGLPDEEEPGLELEAQVRAIVSEMLNEEELEESHGRGAREYSSDISRNQSTGRNSVQESIQIIDDGILVQEVTSRVFTRLHKMLNERKKTK